MAPSERESMGSPFVFILSVGAIQIFGILAMVLTGIWMGKYLGGFAWDGTAHEFNYHPLCMVISMVFLYSEAMIVYRVFRHENKFFIKLVHFGLQLVAFVIAVLGLKAVFDFHNHNGIPNLYSLHSWCGLSTIILFSCQLLFGFVSFLFPKLPDGLRAAYLKVHVFFGMFIFMMVIGTALIGINEKLFFQLSTKYSTLPAAGQLGNVLGITLIILAGTVMFVVTNSAFKRVDTDEERVSLMNDK
ncbi:transmembrane ascorbate-dependent reductase CYB561-like [Pocillopora verrucosa]|uniref:transmembrane ascorbate-dependent reductase CYB561-like n=1 Tax=Pocillopora verrucosa TaxID=203993 RepID=UPI0027979F65|nr:transmembrane ascorbate-dependent reductase CYB561-like [Pocillopora verrucosa]